MPYSSFTGTQLQAIYAAQTLAWGEAITFDRGGTYYGPINVLSDHPSNVYLQQNFFDPDELVGLEQPLVALYIDGTGGGIGYVPTINDTFPRDGITYVIQKVGIWRLNNVIIAYLAMGAEGS